MMFLGFVATIVLLYGFAFSMAQTDGPDGKQIFMDNKCNMCHSIEVLEIEGKKKDSADLSTTGADHDAEFLMQYLKKEAATGEDEHKVKFKGTDEELQVLVDWLVAECVPAETE